MGFFDRLIGKFTNSDLGKKIIGKTAHAAKHVIGKVEHAYKGFKHSMPTGVQNAMNALENDINFAKDTKASYAAAKQDLEHYSKGYGDGE
jgi:hypothetical protein